MKRINRYVLQHLAIAATVATVILLFAVWMTQSLRYIEVIVDDSAPLGVFLTLVALSIPDILTIVLPVAAVGGVIFVYHRLLSDSELVVLRAAGMGPMRLARPAIGLSIVFMALIYTMNMAVAPLANQQIRMIELLVDARYASAFLRDGQFNQIEDEITVYFRERRRTGEMLGILIHDRRNPEMPSTVTARRGLVTETGEGPRVVLFDGSRQEYDRRSRTLSVLDFTQYTMDLTIIEPDLADRTLRPRERFLGDLLSPDVDPNEDARWYTRLVYEGHERLAWPLVTPAMTLLALAALLAGEFTRRGQAWRVLGSITFSATVILLFLAAGSFARDAVMFAPLLYVTPIGGILAGLFLLYRRSNRWFPLGWVEALTRLGPVVTRLVGRRGAEAR